MYGRTKLLTQCLACSEYSGCLQLCYYYYLIMFIIIITITFFAWQSKRPWENYKHWKDCLMPLSSHFSYQVLPFHWGHLCSHFLLEDRRFEIGLLCLICNSLCWVDLNQNLAEEKPAVKFGQKMLNDNSPKWALTLKSGSEASDSLISGVWIFNRGMLPGRAILAEGVHASRLLDRAFWYFTY